MRRASSGERTLALDRASARRLAERLRGGQPRIRAQVQVARFQAGIEAQRLGIDLHHLGVRKHVAAVDRVVVEAGAETDHEVCLFADLARDVARKSAGNADRERVVVEHAARRQRGGEQGTRLLRQLLDGVLRAGAERPAPSQQDGTARIREHRRELLDLARARRQRLDRRQHVRGRLVVADIRQRLLLQVVGNAEHDRPALELRDMERFAHILVHLWSRYAPRCSAHRRQPRTAAGRGADCTSAR